MEGGRLMELTRAVERTTRPAFFDFVGRLADFRERLEPELARFFARKRAEVALEPEGLELVEEVERLITTGGKRLRPALVYYTYRACGGETDADVLPLAMSTELLHTYLLIHDDIMDHSEVRRGQAAAHARFQEKHIERRYGGDAGDFGRSVAMLLGDLAHTWAVELYTTVRRPPGSEALDRAFSRMCEEVIRGQYLEMLLPHEADPGEDRLLRALRLKSGRYSVERPIELGALLAGVSAVELVRLGTYGRAIGEAFQLHDDILGTFGDASAVGKPVGSDLMEGKFTFLIHHALRRAAPEEGKELHALLGRPDLDADQVERGRDIIRETGGLAAVQEMIEGRLEEASAALEGAALGDEGRAFFGGLIEYSRRRDR